MYPIGPLHREPAVPRSQQAVGRHRGLPPRLCPHDDEAGAGTRNSSTCFSFRTTDIVFFAPTSKPIRHCFGCGFLSGLSLLTSYLHLTGWKMKLVKCQSKNKVLRAQSQFHALMNLFRSSTTVSSLNALSSPTTSGISCSGYLVKFPNVRVQVHLTERSCSIRLFLCTTFYLFVPV